MKEDTVYKWLKKDWIITMKQIRDLDINPNKNYELLTLIELYRLSDFLDVLVGDIVD